MMKKIIDVVIPHAVGLLLIVFGWSISAFTVYANTLRSLYKVQSDVLFTTWTGFGLLLIIIGAYIPWIWIGIREKYSKN